MQSYIRYHSGGMSNLTQNPGKSCSNHDLRADHLWSKVKQNGKNEEELTEGRVMGLILNVQIDGISFHLNVYLQENLPDHQAK